MDLNEYDDFVKKNDGRVVLIKFADGTTGLYMVASNGVSGDADFSPVEADPQKLPVTGVPYGFSPDYLDDMINISDVED